MQAGRRYSIQVMAALAVAFVACSDATAPTDSQALKPNEVRGFVASSAANPAVNDQITITFGVRRGSEAAMIGSAAGTITFDATAFEFVQESNPAPGSGVVAMAVTSAGVLSFAAASADGFTGDNIAAVTVKVLKTGATSSVALHLAELANVNLEDKTP